ncbi:hypothetical protein ABG067_004577 [Albugo candida]|uniref:Secreted protein n=1 Tax=Albugo candida TaxID=65357 RepID=A0A024G481_9STRA|nr:unnamed protein product [Albugo candida]|eukprot:CCI41669.1 unnamed protein product [Albugo candida]
MVINKVAMITFVSFLLRLALALKQSCLPICFHFNITRHQLSTTIGHVIQWDDSISYVLVNSTYEMVLFVDWVIARPISIC